MAHILAPENIVPSPGDHREARLRCFEQRAQQCNISGSVTAVTAGCKQTAKCIVELGNDMCYKGGNAEIGCDVPGRNGNFSILKHLENSPAGWVVDRLEPD